MGSYAEQRAFPRYSCTGTAEILQSGKVWGWGKVSDICRGGCYIESEYTLPVGAETQLHLTIANVQLDIVGRVVSATPLVGMGMNFVAVLAEQENNLTRIIEHVAGISSPSVAPQEERPKPSTVRITREAAPEILAKVIRRINEKGALTRQELVEIVKAYQ